MCMRVMSPCSISNTLQKRPPGVRPPAHSRPSCALPRVVPSTTTVFPATTHRKSSRLSAIAATLARNPCTKYPKADFPVRMPEHREIDPDVFCKWVQGLRAARVGEFEVALNDSEKVRRATVVALNRCLVDQHVVGLFGCRESRTSCQCRECRGSLHVVSGPTRTIDLPWFFPASSCSSACGAAWSPSVISSRCMSLPSWIMVVSRSDISGRRAR